MHQIQAQIQAQSLLGGLFPVPYRHISRNLLLSVLSIGSTVALSTFTTFSSAIAQPATQPATQPTAQLLCPGDQNIATATTTRIAEFQSLSTKVTIPANFRTLLYNDGTIAILHPVDFNLIQCLTLGLPILGTDAIRPTSFRLIPNPAGLSPQGYAATLDMSGFTLSEPTSMQTIHGIQVVIREATEQSGLASEIAYAWYQPAGVDGIVEVSTATREDLLDVLSRIQLSDSVLSKSQSTHSSLHVD